MKTKQNISFLLNGEPVTIDFGAEKIKPSTTVLNWLRKDKHHTEVKEGCAEGDCGACTVVMASPDASGKALEYKAVNACLLFLPAIDGKLLITSRGLSPETTFSEELHPVQKAVVDEHATQCGFCTPGFIMSLFAQYHNPAPADDAEINNALAGNLCRCTGYDSIRKAAKAVMQNRIPDLFDKEEKVLIEKLNIIKPDAKLEVLAMEQYYVRPLTLDQALAARHNHPEAIVINGSSDIALQQSKHFRHIPAILDISGVAELKTFERDGNELKIGAGLSLESIRTALQNLFPAFHDILSVFASRQIRQVATLGGNIGSASPIGDTAPLLMACNADLKLVSEKGSRIVPIRDFVVSYRKTVLEANELIAEIYLAIPQKNEIVKMYKVSKRHDMDISTVSAAFRLTLDNNVVSDICMYYGGMAAMTLPVPAVEAFLNGKEWSEQNISAAMEMVKTTFTPLSDARSGAEFRNIAAANLLLQFFNDTKIS
ncbi:MAG TPA: xanthine dehydrogenase small subunit [Bacteroidales bacterium]|nr:xanthine dehydrogenase small subunit [Bacteroidales bacterium]HCY22008.1 xanthine dehydrogenase small subunit [Bacteroidales bacterium]